MHNTRREIVGIKRNDRIAQLELNPVHEIEWELAENLELSDRGDSGLGSTGN